MRLDANVCNMPTEGNSINRALIIFSLAFAAVAPKTTLSAQGPRSVLSPAVPPELARVIDAVDRVGFIGAAAFVDTTLTDRDSPRIRAQLDSGFLSIPTGAGSVILASDRIVIAVDSGTSFLISAYCRNGHLRLIRMFAPLVNGSERQNVQMLATVDSVASVLANGAPGLSEWIASSWQAVWRDWEGSRTRADRVKERRFGDYLMAVSGVPPDFVFFGAIRLDQGT